jgi:hypothetical protein
MSEKVEQLLTEYYRGTWPQYDTGYRCLECKHEWTDHTDDCIVPKIREACQQEREALREENDEMKAVIEKDLAVLQQKVINLEHIAALSALEAEDDLLREEANLLLSNKTFLNTEADDE